MTVQTDCAPTGEGFPMPAHGIMCFHCGEVFKTIGSASDHFGTSPDRTPGCLIDRVALEEGGKPERGRGLLMELRKVEAERDEWHARALSAEAKEDLLDELYADMQRRFGTVCIWTISDRLSDERFRADHAMKLLDGAGIPFDQPAPVMEPAR